MSKLYDEIMVLPNNKERVNHFINLGLHPKYGLSSELTMLMVDLYVAASGDTTMSGRYNCGGCLDTIFRKMKDFVIYNDNLGKPLNDWPTEEEPKQENNEEDEI